jgi:mannose-1-phosphate guanylyltransferase/mannose-6-phosphate isomerase
MDIDNKYLALYSIQEDVSIIEALKKIDANTKGFLVLLNTRDEVVGVITDGDIRRAFIKGATINDSILQYAITNFTSLNQNNDIADAIEIFKNKAIKFLPILDEQGKLLNILTKGQLHALLLQDIHADLKYNFSSLDDSVVDYEIYQRPWGFYKTTVLNDYFQSKVISVKPNQQLSLQSHSHREEHWIVAHGSGTVQIEKSVINVFCGSSLFIPKGVKHRLTNTDPKDNLIITEVQIGDYLGEDDIVRYEDNYGRV